MKRFMLVGLAAIAALAGVVIWRLAGESGERTTEFEAPVEPLSRETSEPRRSKASAMSNPTTAPTEDTSTSNAAVAPRGVVVVGKTVDSRRRGLASSLDIFLDGIDPLRARSGADGRFAIDTGVLPENFTRHGALRAMTDDGAGGMAEIRSRATMPRTLDLGTIVLLPGGKTMLRAVAEGLPVAGARVYVGRGRSLGFGPFVSDKEGLVGPLYLTPDSYHATAFSGTKDRGDVDFSLALGEDAAMDIPITKAWRLEVSVIDESTNKPCPGVKLAAQSVAKSGERLMTSFEASTAEPIAPTDANGKTVVTGLSTEYPVTFSIVDRRALDFRMRMSGETPQGTAKPGDEMLVINIPAGETFTFPIVADETEGPPDGSTVTLKVPPGYGGGMPPETGKIVGRSIVIDRVPARGINLLATARDGTMAIVRILGDARKTKIGSEAKFKTPRKLTVSVRDRGGNVPRGVSVRIATQGNSPVGDLREVPADGLVEFSGLYPERYSVKVGRPNAGELFGKESGSIDLAQPGDRRLDVVVEEERSFVVRMTLNGEARLPTTYGLSFDRATIGEIDEDADRGVLRFAARPANDAKDLKLTANAAGCAPVSIDVPAARESAPTELEVALVSGATVRVKIVPPADQMHDVRLERYIAERSLWSFAVPPMSMRGQELGKRANDFTVDGLPPGRYRARDALTGIVGEPVEVSSGGTVDLTIDLSRSGSVSVRVDAPTDGEFAPASVLIEAEGLMTDDFGRGDGGRPIRLNVDEAIRVPGDRPVSFKVSHPLLVPDPSAAAVLAKSPGEKVVLKLIHGAEAKFGIAADSPAKLRGDDRLKVFLFSGDVADTPVHTCEVNLDQGVGVFGGFAEGRYTIWIDTVRGVPIVLKDVLLGPSSTDLGELSISEGTVLRCKILVPDGADLPQPTLTATSTAKPTYSRVGYGRAAEFFVRGLGPGEFKLNVQGLPLSTKITPTSIQSTGSGEIVVTIDLR